MAQNITISSPEEYKEGVEKYSLVTLKAGSKTQGTSSETSDDDVKGIHFNPMWMDFPELTEDKASLEGNDVSSYGLDRFRELLSKGNWDAVEMIHTGLAGGVYKDLDKKEIIKFDDIVKLDNPHDRSAILDLIEYYWGGWKALSDRPANLPKFVNMIRPSSIYLWWIFVYPEKFISKLTFNNTKGFISYNSKSQKWDGEVANKDMDLKTGEVKNSKHIQHAFRVYNTCIQCIEESEKAGTVVPLRINREGIDADWLKELKYNNKYSAKELLDMLIEKKNKLEELMDKTTVIPNKIPKEVIDALNESCKLIKRDRYYEEYSCTVISERCDQEFVPEELWGERNLFNFKKNLI